VTLTASYQKVFSDDPKLGFFSQRDSYKEALDRGEVMAPAENHDDMQAIVTNSTVDGILAALFAVLIIVVILDASRIWFKTIRARRPVPTTEVEFQPSRIVAPAGLFWTSEERAALATTGPSRRFARTGEREPTRTGGGP
jgi:carbon starvation protein